VSTEPERNWRMKNSRLAATFITAIVVSGLVMLGSSAMTIGSLHQYPFLSLLVMAVLASRMKVKLPGLDGNMSVNLPFILIAAARLSPFEAVTVAFVSSAVQSIPQFGKKSAAKFQPVKMLFNASTMVLAAGVSALLLHGGWLASATPQLGALSLVAACSAFFLVNTLPVATIISLTEGSHLLRIWSSIFHLSFPYYLACTGVTSIVTAMSQHLGWQMPLVILPVMLLLYRCYRLYFGRTPELEEFRPVSPATKVKAMAAGAH